MPSPFPGMDPYIEHPDIWSDFHGDLAGEIRAQLNGLIQPNYVARLTPYVTYEVIELSETRGVRPDIGVYEVEPSTEPASSAAPTVTPAPVQSLVPLEIPLRLYSVEIRSLSHEMQLVTALEILSPVNKRPGHQAHTAYLRKRRELLRSETHLLEIDLLRGGERPPLETPVPPAPYYMTLSRAERRPHVEVWPVQLSDELPNLPIPLLEPDPDVFLDLGATVTAVYERGAYSALIDYREPPPPPSLSEAQADWLSQWLVEAGLRQES